jgi:phage terminase small subunit
MPKKDVWNVPPVVPKKAAQRMSEKVPSLSSLKTMTGRKRMVTPKHWKFITEYVSGDGRVTMKEAAIQAGYNEKSASVIAWQLTNPDINPHVVAAIQQYRAELASKYNTSYERHMKDLQLIRDKALEAGAFAAAVQAEYRRGQALGTIYVERKEIRHGTIDSMSKEEVQRKLDELKKLYGGPPPTAIIDLEPSDVRESAEKDVDPTFTLPVAEPPPDVFERLSEADGEET